MKNLPILIIILLIVSCSKKVNMENELSTLLTRQHDLYNFNGNVLIAENGKVVYRNSLGYANYYSKQKLNDSTIFELASITKQFTAMGILILIEKGRLNLSDSLRSFFPQLPYSGISIKHLLTHTSGLPDYMDIMAKKWDHSKIAYNNDMISLLASENLPKHFHPGEKWEYSNTGYALLASIIEKVSGKSYKEFMAESVFKPLKLHNTFVYTRRASTESLPNYAYGFVFSDSLKQYILPDSVPELDYVYYLDGLQGDGCVNSTTGDLLKWTVALTKGKIVKDELRMKMISPHALADTVKKVSYGFGIMLGKDVNGDYMAHSGGWAGYSTYMIHYPDYNRTIIVLSNNMSASTQIANSLSHIIFGQELIMPYEHTNINLDTTALDRFTGTYKINGTNYKFIREKTKLYRVSPGSQVEFLPESETKIFLKDKFDLQYEFIKEPDGGTKYYRIVYGVKEEMVKVDG